MANILVVDDSRLFRREIVNCLSKSGYTTHEAVDGFDALDKCKQISNIDLIMCDLNMPNMDGFTLVEKLRQTEEHKQTSIIFLSAESSPAAKEKAIELGVIAWIIKPFDPNKLIAGIQKIL